MDWQPIRPLQARLVIGLRNARARAAGPVMPAEVRAAQAMAMLMGRVRVPQEDLEPGVFELAEPPPPVAAPASAGAAPSRGPLRRLLGLPHAVARAGGRFVRWLGRLLP